MSQAEAVLETRIMAQGLTLLRQAAPMVLSRAGLAAMAVTDAVMVAHYSSADLAAANLADGTFGRLADVFMAFLHAALVLVVAAAAPSRRIERLSLWQRAVKAALLMGVLGLLLALMAPTLLALAGQPPDVSQLAGSVIRLLACGLPMGLVAIACAIHLEAVGRAGLVAAAMVIANLANVAGNWLLIEGNLGFPAFGVEGSAAVTSMVRIALAVALVAAVRLHEGPGAFARQPAAHQTRPDHFRLGFSALGAAATMHLLGIWLTFFAGWLGPLSLAAFSAGWILNLPGLLLAAGLGDAMALRVAQRQTRTGQPERQPVMSDLSVLAGLLLPWVLCLSLLPAGVAGLYTPDPALQSLMVMLLPMSGLVLLLDGLSYAVAAALRGLKDIALPTVIQVVAMLATPLLAWLFAFGLSMGVTGLLVAILITSSARLILLGLRMFKLFRPSAV